MYSLMIMAASGVNFPMIAMLVVLIVILVLVSNRKKGELKEAWKEEVKVSDEVITLQGVRGRVTKIEGDMVNIVGSYGEEATCKLTECVSVRSLVGNSGMLKLSEDSETTYRLIVAGKQYLFPSQSSAAKLLKWMRNTRLAYRGVALMLACAFINLLSYASDIMTLFEYGIRAYLRGDVVQDLILPIGTTVGLLIGVVMHLTGLRGVASLSDHDDKKEIANVENGFYFFFAAAIIDFLPLDAWVSLLLYLIGFILLIIGYARLKNSSSQGDTTRKGYAQAFAASILLLISCFLPDWDSLEACYMALSSYDTALIVTCLGSISPCIGYMIYCLAWKEIATKSLYAEWKPTTVAE